MSTTYRLSLTSVYSSPMDRFSYRDRRVDYRIELPMPVSIRRPNNSPDYRKTVVTQNVSRNGARLLLDIPLELDAELVVYAFGGQFSAKAVVRNVVKQRDGRWAVGVQFVEKQGQWIIT